MDLHIIYFSPFLNGHGQCVIIHVKKNSMIYERIFYSGYISVFWFQFTNISVFPFGQIIHLGFKIENCTISFFVQYSAHPLKPSSSPNGIISSLGILKSIYSKNHMSLGKISLPFLFFFCIHCSLHWPTSGDFWSLTVNRCLASFS